MPEAIDGRPEVGNLAAGDQHQQAVTSGLARERRVPPYVIFSDRSLIDMAERRPASVREFAEVHGVGAAKLKDFGEIFLSAIAGHGAA